MSTWRKKNTAVLFWWICSHIMVSVIWPEACLDDRYCLHGYIITYYSGDLLLNQSCRIFPLLAIGVWHAAESAFDRQSFDQENKLIFNAFRTAFLHFWGTLVRANLRCHLSEKKGLVAYGMTFTHSPLRTLCILSMQLFVTSNYPLHCP